MGPCHSLTDKHVDVFAAHRQVASNVANQNHRKRGGDGNYSKPKGTMNRTNEKPGCRTVLCRATRIRNMDKVQQQIITYIQPLTKAPVDGSEKWDVIGHNFDIRG